MLTHPVALVGHFPLWEAPELVAQEVIERLRVAPGCFRLFYKSQSKT
jgi:hypothetical protein